MNPFVIILLALDSFLFSVICWGNVYPGEYASSAAYRIDQRGRWQGKLFRPMIDFFFGKDHCRHSWEMQRGMTQAPHVNWPNKDD